MNDVMKELKRLTNSARDEEAHAAFLVDTLRNKDERKAVAEHLAHMTMVRSQLDEILIGLMNRDDTLNKAGEELAKRLGVPVVNIEWYDTGDDGVEDWSAPVMATVQFDGEDWARFAIADAVSDYWLEWLAESLLTDC